MKHIKISKSKLLRVNQVAERLNCSSRHVYYLIESAQLKALSIGKNPVGKRKGIRVSDHELESFILKRIRQFGEETGFEDEESCF